MFGFTALIQDISLKHTTSFKSLVNILQTISVPLGGKVPHRLDEGLVFPAICRPDAPHLPPDTDPGQEKDDAVQIQSALSLLKFR